MNLLRQQPGKRIQEHNRIKSRDCRYPDSPEDYNQALQEWWSLCLTAMVMQSETVSNHAKYIAHEMPLHGPAQLLAWWSHQLLQLPVYHALCLIFTSISSTQ